jgi:hypothetical protein
MKNATLHEVLLNNPLSLPPRYRHSNQRVSFMTPQSQAWYPIKSAPKDGTKIDVWLSKSRRRVTNCYWGRPSHTCGENEGYCDSCPDHDGWVDGEDFMCGYTDEEPTHWMPIPTPPP